MDHIGPYRILKLIRPGSSTHVWEAMNPIDNQRLAIKSLQPEHQTSKNLIAELKHEHAVGQTLDHPNVNPVFEFDIVRNVPFVVMNFFRAPNLKQSIRDHSDRVEGHRESIIRQAAAGLHHLHECGWVHRDIKPDNFLLNDKGEVRLIDFALAVKLKSKSKFGSMFGGKSKVVGTRSYMSPEQIRGEHVGRQADLYSLGCVVFELFVKRPPFTGINSNDLLTKHLRAPIPALASSFEGITPEFSRLVAKTLAKKPESRHETVQEFIDELDSIQVMQRKVKK